MPCDVRAARISPVDAIAFVFSIFVIYGCGAEAVLYGLILLLLGIPVYVWQRHEQVSVSSVAPGVVPSPATDRIAS